MRKINILMLLIFIGIPFIEIPVVKAEETLGDLNNKLNKLENSYAKKEEELNSKKSNLETIYNELKITAEEKAGIQTEITATKNEIMLKKKEIQNLEKQEIPSLEEKAITSLKFSQKNENNNIFLANMYNNLKETDTNYLELTQSSNKIFTKLNSSLFELINMLNQLEEDKKSLEIDEVNLTAKNKELEINEDYLSTLQTTLSQEISKIEKETANQQDAIQAAEEKQKIFEEAGCGPNDVYGVDCGQTSIPQSDGEFSKPLSHGVVTNEFLGWTSSDNYTHKGIDLAASNGTPIYPTTAGKVLYSGWTNDGGGNSVILLHVSNGKNYISRYAHLSSTNVSVGDTVVRSQTIGAVGNTGNSFGSHLHFEMQEGSNYNWATLQNPRLFVTFPVLGISW